MLVYGIPEFHVRRRRGAAGGLEDPPIGDQAASGATAAPNVSLPQPGRLVGVLRRGKTAPGAIGLAHPAPLVLVVEQETPAAPGVAPAPPPAGDAPDSLQYVGAYAPTWFGLAAVAACFYAAMLWRRYRP